MRVEQEQKVTEDARRYAEQDAAEQRCAAQVLQVCNLYLFSCFKLFAKFSCSEVSQTLTTPTILKRNPSVSWYMSMELPT